LLERAGGPAQCQYRSPSRRLGIPGPLTRRQIVVERHPDGLKEWSEFLSYPFLASSLYDPKGFLIVLCPHSDVDQLPGCGGWAALSSADLTLDNQCAGLGTAEVSFGDLNAHNVSHRDTVGELQLAVTNPAVLDPKVSSTPTQRTVATLVLAADLDRTHLRLGHCIGLAPESPIQITASHRPGSEGCESGVQAVRHRVM